MLLVAAIGPMSSALEALATAIGAGMLLGAFVIGALARLGHLRGGRRHDDQVVVDAGYCGGLVAGALFTVDLIIG